MSKRLPLTCGALVLGSALCITGLLYGKTRPPSFPPVESPPTVRPVPLPSNQNAATIYLTIRRGTPYAEGLERLNKGAGLPYQAEDWLTGAGNALEFLADLRNLPVDAEADVLVFLRRLSLQSSGRPSGQAAGSLENQCASLSSRLGNLSMQELSRLRKAAEEEPCPDLYTRLTWQLDDATRGRPQQDYVRQGLMWELSELRQGRHPSAEPMNYGMWADTVIKVPLVNLLAPPLRFMHGTRFDDTARYYQTSNQLRFPEQYDNYQVALKALSELRSALDAEIALRRKGKVPPERWEVTYVLDSQSKAIHCLKGHKIEASLPVPGVPLDLLVSKQFALVTTLNGAVVYQIEPRNGRLKLAAISPLAIRYPVSADDSRTVYACRQEAVCVYDCDPKTGKLRETRRFSGTAGIKGLAMYNRNLYGIRGNEIVQVKVKEGETFVVAEKEKAPLTAIAVGRRGETPVIVVLNRSQLIEHFVDQFGGRLGGPMVEVLPTAPRGLTTDWNAQAIYCGLERMRAIGGYGGDGRSIPGSPFLTQDSPTALSLEARTLLVATEHGYLERYSIRSDSSLTRLTVLKVGGKPMALQSLAFP